MKRPGIVLFLCLACLLSAGRAATAGDKLWIRLVEASHVGPEGGAGLEDVVPVLKKSLAYSKFKLVSQTTSTIGGNQAPVLGGYTISYSGNQENLFIVVYRGNRELVKTRVSLKDNKPLIVGGFPSRNGSYVLVFVAK